MRVPFKKYQSFQSKIVLKIFFYQVKKKINFAKKNS